MFAIAIIIVSYATAVLGVAHSHAAKDGQRSYRGFSRLGLALIVLATVGMAIGVTKEVFRIQAAERLAEREAERDQALKEIHAVVVGVRNATTDPSLAKQLETLSDRISATASRSRGSNFRMSDFSQYDFSSGNFTQASFRDALFNDADLRGADLSTAVTDERTRFPAR